jgi:hypothetical protein
VKPLPAYEFMQAVTKTEAHAIVDNHRETYQNKKEKFSWSKVTPREQKQALLRVNQTLLNNGTPEVSEDIFYWRMDKIVREVVYHQNKVASELPVLLLLV